MNELFIYKSNGQYMGFARYNNLYTRDGIYLGYIKGNFAWDAQGQFRGSLTPIETQQGTKIFVIKNMFAINPYPQEAKQMNNLAISELPLQLPPISPITLDVGYVDGF
jgi:hypothetical protein